MPGRPSMRASRRGQGPKADSADGPMEENDVLRMRILRERGRASMARKQTVDDDDFEAILEKEGVGAGVEVSTPISFVERASFDLVIGVAILINSLVLGLEIDLAEHTDPMIWIVYENVFCTIWITETLVKWWVLRLRYFYDAWNWLDLFLVMLSIYDAWIAPFVISAGTMDLGFLRVVRVMRLLRLVKLIRVIKMSRNLWLLVQGFIESFSTLSWVSFLIFFVIYAYSALFRIVVDCGKDFAGWSDCNMMFGTMPKSMFTMFQVLTLESWSMVISRPLMEVHPVLVVAIISFILLTTFGLLNIIVGVVVENTLSVAKQNVDLQNKRAEKQVIKELELLRTVFEEADVDGSGTMDKDEFIEICNSSSVKRALQRMGVPLDQSETLFDIIDSGHKGEVTFGGFIEGVKKVRGVPTSLDMKTMMVAVRNIYKQQVRLEKDSQDLQLVLLDLIEEAQRNGNVIKLPPQEEMEGLLTVRKDLRSQMSFCSLKSPVSPGSSTAPSLFGRAPGRRMGPKEAPRPPSPMPEDTDAPAVEEEEVAELAERRPSFSDPVPSFQELAPSKSSAVEGELSTSIASMRESLPNLVPEDPFAVPQQPAVEEARVWPVVEEVGSSSSSSIPLANHLVVTPAHVQSAPRLERQESQEERTLKAVVMRSKSRERLPVTVVAKQRPDSPTAGSAARRPGTARVRLRNDQLVADHTREWRDREAADDQSVAI